MDKSSKKYRCQQCGKKSLVRYVDGDGNLQSEEYGRCDREVNCGYILYPESEGEQKPFIPKPPKPQVYFPEDVFIKTLQNINQSNLYKNLVELKIPSEDINKTLEDYKIGALTNGKYSGAVTFPFIDHLQRINSVQVKMFDENNKTQDQTWLHSILYHYYKNKTKIPEWITKYYDNEKKTNCLFGEHLLDKYSTKDIIIAESPKNTILGTFFMPEYLWMASGSLRTLSVSKLKKLRGRNILLIPDTSVDNVAFDEWNIIKENAVDAGLNVKMLTFLEDIATIEQKTAGYDIADYITEELKREPETLPIEPPPPPITAQVYTQAERVKVGLEFSTEGLAELAKKIIPENDSVTAKELIQKLYDIEGLDKKDATDLMLVMRLKEIIDKTNDGRYFLFNSTPY
ncbi:DUF6371 domain-containing protein [Kaistella sp. SH19-2b]|uniref:DUF6371 domain-containing protein n=1 Tax=Kaistella sp. SH19-2b TaxID=2986944 RepID=UPI0027330EFB|nr:DUF6371 domain-containing protein [Kaistella sp. SH19-2b]MDP2458452.1 DUF6371 domain-containing protein [Kaistella sp. SH19-2b]